MDLTKYADQLEKSAEQLSELAEITRIEADKQLNSNKLCLVKVFDNELGYLNFDKESASFGLDSSDNCLNERFKVLFTYREIEELKRDPRLNMIDLDKCELIETADNLVIRES